MKKFTTTHIILFSFLSAIVVGTFLLSLPVSTVDGKSVGVIDALFTATTSVCVTGLVTLPTFSTWSVFGQVVILLLIQIGGLGVITVMSSFALFVNKRMGLKKSLVLQDAFNLNTLFGLSSFIKKVVVGTLLVEGIGALLYMTVFVRDFGLRGIWMSLFTSVSAFCNAGIDIIGENSLADYCTNPLVNFTTASLIVLGGLGFIVWWDILRVIKDRKKKTFSRLSLHTKIVIVITLILILSGALSFFVFEYNNPETLAPLSLFNKIQASFFQSVTTRTAGFFTLPQQNFTDASAFVSMLLMFVGGSPAGCAGGVKTVTVAVLVIFALSGVKNKNETVLFGRSIAKDTLHKAFAVVFVSFVTLVLSFICLLAFSNINFVDALYECVSAVATVGLSRDVTSHLNTVSKIIVILTMYAGRVGPISLAVMFKTGRGSENIIKCPVEEISVG